MKQKDNEWQISIMHLEKLQSRVENLEQEKQWLATQNQKLEQRNGQLKKDLQLVKRMVEGRLEK